LTNYGRRRTYKIVKINYEMTPFSKFFHDKKAGQVTFAQYYEESYGLKISQKNQPLVEVVLRVEKSFDKAKGSIIKRDIMGFLIPEFISLTGMSDEQRANFNTMKSIAPYTKLSPKERVNQTNQLV
jgi:aubergine-like protein